MIVPLVFFFLIFAIDVFVNVVVRGAERSADC